MELIQKRNENADMQDACLTLLKNNCAPAHALLKKAVAHGVELVGFFPTIDEETTMIGAYLPRKNVILVNLAVMIDISQRNPETFRADMDDLILALAHESQHALNVHEGRILPDHHAAEEGEAAYVQQSEWDEAVAWAQTFVVAQHLSNTPALKEGLLGEMFADVQYDASKSLDHYADIALRFLRQPGHAYSDDLPLQYSRTVEIADDCASAGYAAKFGKRDPLKPDGSAKGVD